MSLATQLRDNGIGWVDGFLDHPTCSRLADELDFALWRPSTVVSRSPRGDLVIITSRRRHSRTAEQEWFGPEVRQEIHRLEGRACRRLGLRRAHLEPWQAVRYGHRDRFEVHHDSGLFADDPAGERVLTLLLYLQTPAEGGSTVFPELGLRIAAVAGRLVAWRNLLPDGTPNPAMRHAASPVRKGAKTILTTWARQRVVRGRNRGGQPAG